MNADLSPLLPRTLSRILATQALYIIETQNSIPDIIINDFLDDRWKINEKSFTAQDRFDNISITEANKEFFVELVEGVMENKEMIDQIIGGQLLKGRTIDKLDNIVKYILEIGIFEIVFKQENKNNIVINECINVCHCFFSPTSKSKFVNGVLDKVAKNI